MARRTQTASSTASSSSVAQTSPTVSAIAATTATAATVAIASGGPSSSSSSSSSSSFRLTRSSTIRESSSSLLNRAAVASTPAPTVTSFTVSPATSTATSAYISPRKRNISAPAVPPALTLGSDFTAVAATTSASVAGTSTNTTPTAPTNNPVTATAFADSHSTSTSFSSTVRRSTRVKAASEEKQQKDLLQEQVRRQRRSFRHEVGDTHSRKRSATAASSSVSPTAAAKSKRRKVHSTTNQSAATVMSSGHHRRLKEKGHGSSASRAASANAASAAGAGGKSEHPTSPTSARSKPPQLSHRHPTTLSHSRNFQTAKQQKQNPSMTMSKQNAAAAKGEATSQTPISAQASKRISRRQPSDVSMREAAGDEFYAHPNLDANEVEDEDNMDVEDQYGVEEGYQSSGGYDDDDDNHNGSGRTSQGHQNRQHNDEREHDNEVDHESGDNEGDAEDDDAAAMAAFQSDYQDLFGSGSGADGGRSSFHHTLRTLSGFMSGTSSRLREILANLRRPENPSLQFIALQELSDLLLVSNEDNLVGQFSPDAFVRELVKLMQPNEITTEENPEIMLLACRCLANMIEALRGSVANVVYGNAVPILCQKLLDIQFIDLAEQALDTLAKISVDFPAAIVREGGLTACLTYLDFFPTSTQRTAVTTAANCCRNLSPDSFNVVRDVMPILLNVLNSNDQKV
ncbi:Ubiquitin fusion degradation protein 4, partial [Ascosphaera aggregata]